MDKKKINQVSAETEQAIKRKTAYALPDRPSESGMRADEIKKAFYAAMTDKTDSLLAEIKRIVEESNNVDDDLYNLINDFVSQGIENANKVMVTDEKGNVTPSDIIPIGSCKCYTESNDGEVAFVIEFPEEAD